MMNQLQQTPSQTVGPFFAYGLTAEQYGYDYNSIVTGSLVGEESSGERIIVSGKIFDGAGNVVSDAMIEFWQADENGNYKNMIVPGSKDFTGFGRLGTGTDKENRFHFSTIKPGTVSPGQAPHINVILFMRGSLLHLYTRLYFSDEADANAKDEFLKSLPKERVKSLIANEISKDGAKEYQFDIHMQGERETIFFQL